MPAGQLPRDWQPHILISVAKRLDRAIYSAIADYGGGTLVPGRMYLGLAEGGVELSTSGAYIDDISPQLGTLRRAIISGEIDVPTQPAE